MGRYPLWNKDAYTKFVQASAITANMLSRITERTRVP
jgi:hypothetical protein